MFKKFFKLNLVIILIILAASLFRLYKLSVNPPSLFGDELDLGYQALSILKTGRDYQGNFMPVHFHSLAEWRTPLYLYSAVPTVAVFGISPLGVRLPAALFGILSVLAMYLFVKEILVFGNTPRTKQSLALLAAALMTVSPWSLQYSRAGFEVTEMLFLLLIGLCLFLKSLKNPKLFWLSIFCLVLTPWVYSTAKLFTPLLLFTLFILFKKEIFIFPKKHLIYGFIAGLVVGAPIVYSTLFGGGSQRFNYISIFSDPTTESEVGFSRDESAHIRGEQGFALKPNLVDRLVYNKFTYWGNTFLKNYLSSFSTQFLFIEGDPNPRQSIGIGELYMIEIIPLLIGLAFLLFDKEIDKRIKTLLFFWLVVSPIPSSLTVGGGNHATRLILLLPILVFFVAMGINGIYKSLIGNWQKMFTISIVGLYSLSLFFYFHEYYTAYPWNSERWWHYGWGPAIGEIKSIDKNYDRVFISMSGEPAWIFFAGYYQYPPNLWQKNFPIGNDIEVQGFGRVSHTGKFYFGSPDSKVQIYGLGKYIDSKTLYLANANEIGNNLILHPDGVPPGLALIKVVPFPSGEPAFYLFAGTAK